MRIPEKIETGRLLLRPFAPQDFAAFWSFMADSEATRYMAFTDEQKTYNGVKATLQTVIASYAGEEPVCALAITDRQSGNYVGSCGLSPLTEPGEVECYYTVLPKQWGKGYATEATEALLQYASTELGVLRVVAFVMEGNPASIRVAEKLGMTCDGMVNRENVNMPGLRYSVTGQDFSYHGQPWAYHPT